MPADTQPFHSRPGPWRVFQSTRIALCFGTLERREARAVAASVSSDRRHGEDRRAVDRPCGELLYHVGEDETIWLRVVGTKQTRVSPEITGSWRKCGNCRTAFEVRVVQTSRATA